MREPFAAGPPHRYPLGRIARDAGADWAQDSLAWVDLDAQVVHTGAGRRVEYDALLIAVGARQVEAYEHVATFRDADADAAYQGIVQDVEEGYSRSLAFIQPVGPVWPLPLYELALMTAERAESMDIRDLELVLVTPEPRPLAIFGAAVSDVVSNRLARAGIRVYCNSLAKVPATGRLLIEPQGVELHPARMITMPRVAGPSVRGLPGAGAQGLHSDRQALLGARHGRPRVRRRRRSQLSGQARRSRRADGGRGGCSDSRARRARRPRRPAFNPVIRGKLLTGSDPVYMSAHPVGAESFESEVFDEPPWPSDEKVVAEELGPYLATLDASHAFRRSRAVCAGSYSPRDNARDNKRPVHQVQIVHRTAMAFGRQGRRRGARAVPSNARPAHATSTT